MSRRNKTKTPVSSSSERNRERMTRQCFTNVFAKRNGDNCRDTHAQWIRDNYDANVFRLQPYSSHGVRLGYKQLYNSSRNPYIFPEHLHRLRRSKVREQCRYTRRKIFSAWLLPYISAEFSLHEIFAIRISGIPTTTTTTTEKKISVSLALSLTRRGNKARKRDERIPRPFVSVTIALTSHSRLENAKTVAAAISARFSRKREIELWPKPFREAVKRPRFHLGHGTVNLWVFSSRGAVVDTFV